MKNQKFPYAISKVEGDWHNKLLKNFPFQTEGIVQIGPEKWVMPTKFEKFADEIYNFEARPDDIWICTMPRSGATWVQEMIWLICNKLDYEKALSLPQSERFPYFEGNIFVSDTVLNNKLETMTENEFEAFKAAFEPIYSKLSSTTSRRFIKTHLPMKLMPPSVQEVGAKIVYVARNPKDMCVSWYHLHNFTSVDTFIGEFQNFSEYFLNDLTLYSPYWRHVLDGWQNRHLENVHFMFYEDCHADLATSLKKLADFLGQPLQDKDLPKLLQHLSFGNFQKNRAINACPDPTIKNPKFVRRGKIGGNPEMTPELSAKFDEWIQKNVTGTDFLFPFKV